MTWCNDNFAKTIIKLTYKVANSHLPNASKETIVEYTVAYSDLLEKCITEYWTMAKEADGHAADAEKLIEAWRKITHSLSLAW